jgi:DNA repair protein RecO (recombination protein O)
MQTSDIYIIKITPYRESSNLYEAIAKDYGKITLIHKGVKTNKKKFSLELFCSYKINWSGKGGIKFLREYDIIERLDLLPKHNIVGMYFNELMHYLTKNDYQIEKLYGHYGDSLKSLKTSNNFLIDLNNYEIGILILTGHYLIFDTDTNDQIIDKRKNYSYIPDFGPKIDSSSKNTYSGETLAALSGSYFYNDKTIKESRVLMKRLIDYYIQPKKIKTREILKYISL